MTRFARRFRKVSSTLSRVELMRSSMDATFALTDIDLLDKDAGRRFLDFYGDDGLRLALERYGLFEAVRARGYDHFELETWAHDDRHTLLVDGRTPGSAEAVRLIELMVRRDRLRIDPVEAYGPLDQTWEVLTVDWLTLRHPCGTFSQDRLRLPGQDAPGLGIGEAVLEMLYRVVERLHLGALVTVPEYFHNATLYARELPYVDPWYTGQLRALERLLFEQEKLPFAQAAWAVHWGHVLDESDRSFAWRGEAMLHPHDEDLAKYLRSDAYAEAARKSERSQRYRLHRAAFDDQWSRDHASLLAIPD
ncbi:MAG: hypothetical protein K8H88_07925 [Sandaracinaceae bacterium]|nr:hypothetical protein [Sandaracinaceae bacterium]